MEPRIQYAQTKDGVSIAYWMLGEGAPIVHTILGQFGHMQMEWENPEFRRWYERLAEKRMVVRYDPRGSGLSEREVSDFSLDAQLLDLEAVVDRLGLDRFALFAYYLAGPVAISYATRHPERLSHLLLWCSWARAADAYDSPQAQSMIALREQDWTTYTETVAHVTLGWSAGEPARQYAAYIRESVTRETMLAVASAATGFDVTSQLSEVKVPTLVLHRRKVPLPEEDIARGLASRIPDARLAVMEGKSLAPWLEDVEAALSAIDEFLGEGERADAKAGPVETGAFRTILFTDVEGSTALTDRLGDAKARELLREHERMVREALKAHGGSEVKALGDGFMTSFSSATMALECAIAMQRAFEERNASLSAHPEALEGRAEPGPPAHGSTGSPRADRDAGASLEPLRVRIGLNAGEPIAEDDDLFGTAVNLAARIAAKAEGGEILASEAVRQIVAGKKFPFSDRGETALRGFEDRVHIYQVSWREEIL